MINVCHFQDYFSFLHELGPSSSGTNLGALLSSVQALTSQD